MTEFGTNNYERALIGGLAGLLDAAGVGRWLGWDSTDVYGSADRAILPYDLPAAPAEAIAVRPWFAAYGISGRDSYRSDQETVETSVEFIYRVHEVADLGGIYDRVHDLFHRKRLVLNSSDEDSTMKVYGSEESSAYLGEDDNGRWLRSHNFVFTGLRARPTG